MIFPLRQNIYTAFTWAKECSNAYYMRIIFVLSLGTTCTVSIPNTWFSCRTDPRILPEYNNTHFHPHDPGNLQGPDSCVCSVTCEWEVHEGVKSSCTRNRSYFWGKFNSNLSNWNKFGIPVGIDGQFELHLISIRMQYSVFGCVMNYFSIPHESCL